MKERIRVLHLVPWVASGGVERRRLTLARRLDPDRFEQRLVCLEILTPLGEQLRAAGLPVEAIGGTWSYRDLRSATRIRRVIGAYRPHVVHGAVYEGGVMAGWSSVGPRRHRTIVEETDVPVARRWGGHAILGAAAHAADVCVAVSRTVGRYFRETLRVPEDHLRVILNGVEPPRPVSPEEIAQVRSGLGFEPHHRVVGTVGRLHNHHKRQSDLIEAFARIQNDVVDARLCIVGSGPDREMLEQKVRALGLASKVRFTGYQSDTAPYYAALDVFALVSNREACPLVLQEAMHHGRAVVTTSVGGGAELVDDGHTGLHTPVADPAALAEVIRCLLADSGLRRRLGEAARNRARSHYTAERYAGEVAHLYERLAA
jgi:glycosyltransferase involved in cell wall biosynthesis